MKTHRDLEVWKGSIVIVREIYLITRDFPKHETFGLTSQIRRAAVSVSANISEGAARHTLKEFIHFLYIANGSLSEVETLLHIAMMLGYINVQTYNQIQNMIIKTTAQLSGLIRKVKSSLQIKP